MDEVSSYVCLNLPFVWQGRPKDCSTSSSKPMMEGPGAESEEKREPASDIETAAVDSLKCLTQIGRLEKQTWRLPMHGERYSFVWRELSVGSAEIPLDLI
jgi:hypothetical protein